MESLLHCILVLVLLIASSLLSSPPLVAAKLSTSYYARSCPRAEQIVSDVVTTKQIASPTTGAGALRLFFHDCFSGGCDASVLISSNHFNRAERDADINLSLPGDGFDVVVRAKSALELACPGVVSCSDVLTLATRDLISMVGGPFYPVRLGRKDSFTSRASSALHNLPTANMSVSQIINIFTSKRFSIREMVALTGAHTVGFSHCKEFASGIYKRHNRFDRSLNPQYAHALQKACKNYLRDPTIATFNDVMTPGKFDNFYYKNLLHGVGLLATDRALVADPRTRRFVKHYASNQTAFFEDFARAMQKLSVYGVKTGRKGEVRRRCDAFNNLST
ncbi:peroxidase 31-like [Typha latifolia]|uniref:peroxidase 31-like n=1 Tax=Typha latifolia TaxID=4733 RepID=UPI003C2F66FC